MSLYEGMFLLDNAVVREDWKKAKALVSDALTKHGCTVKTARRWDERKLAYPIKGKNRATYLFVHFEQQGPELMQAMRRELELSERILRYLILKVEEVPAQEQEFVDAENAADFVLPTPPPDDMVEPEPMLPSDEPQQEEVLVPDLDMVDDAPRGGQKED